MLTYANLGCVGPFENVYVCKKKKIEYVAAKVKWWLKYTLTTDSLVRVYFNQRYWLKYTLTKDSLVKVHFNLLK